MNFDGWSLEVTEWRQLESVLHGAKWRSLPLDGLFRDSVPESPGIYLLLTKRDGLGERYQIPEDLVNALYVGRSENLRRRFLEHASISRKNILIDRCREVFGRLSFSYSMVPSDRQADYSGWIGDAESRLISVLSPPANRSVPSRRPIAARLGEPQPI
ncbi:hypothetical protein [Candidatus Poriferisodalis sp.]|uniref:hypothetical protein n=1 Tax=Candidatus Poriferisodalis sp. TaxID=3101277 RepID=UPI003B02C72A